MACRGTPATRAARRAGIRFRARDYEHRAVSQSGRLATMADPRDADHVAAPADLAALTRAGRAPLARR